MDLAPSNFPATRWMTEFIRACHALSLDDERTTFHPVLWDEKKETPRTETPRFTSGERISQVWFAGVHSNIGGGYPDDSLAQIPLYWIMEEAKACGLIFKAANPEAIAETKEAQDKDGRLYDSRSGFGSYYRYGPRRLSRLCRELFSRTMNDEVMILVPKIHELVLRRIQNNAHVYAPIGIPYKYDVVVTIPHPNGVDASFRIDSLPTAAGAANTYELSSDAQARVASERGDIWPRVWLRALLYVLTLLATLFFVVFPLTGRSDPLAEKINALKWLSDIIRTVGGFLPGWASSWVVAYAEYPITFLVVVGLISFLLLFSSKVAAAINDEMTALWKGSLAHSLPVPPVPPSTTLSAGEKAFVALRSGWKDYVGPALSAIAIVYVVLALGNRWAFTAIDEAGLVCEQSEHLAFLPDTGALVSFDASEPCFSTGYKVGRLDRYYVWTNPDLAELAKEYPSFAKGRNACTSSSEPLSDGGIVTDAHGYSTFHNADGAELTWWQTTVRVLWLPFRRYYGQPWFQPVARYGPVGNEVDFLEPDPDRKVTKISEYVTPKVPGELFFFLNDAVLGLPKSFQWFYQDNKGCVSFFVKMSR